SGLWMVGCGDDGACPGGQVSCDDVCIDAIEPTLAGADGIQERVFQGSCAFTNCHGAEGGVQADLELSSASISADNLIDVQSTEVDGLRVAPGNTGASYLVDKLLGQNLAPGTAQMPNVGTALCDAKIQAVEAWIEAGAN
ncbi:MAG TPA: hypothetical protein VFG22_00145, partial [Polyangiales bacterium]|nr:hypothetical protein [Polyangiales bacterium]